MSWLIGIGGGLAAIIIGLFVRKKGWPLFNRRPETIENDIAELDKEKEVADADIEDRRDAYHKRNPFK